MKFHIKWQLLRIRCILTGCTCAENYPACVYCQAPHYPYPDMHRWIDYPGKLGWWISLKTWIGIWARWYCPKKCQQCGKRYYRGYNEYMCSDECFTKWLPF